MNAIEVKNLVKNYDNVKAINDISFTVEEGSFFAFLGENGAGKSTTINILCTALKKTAGKVYVAGLDIDSDENKIKDKIGIVFQGSTLDLGLTVYQNLTYRASLYGYSNKIAQSKIKPIIEKLDLTSILKRKYKTLSGGQKRRVDIARALINEPKILFLDEPTTGLDPQTRLMVWQTINNLRKEKHLTVFLTTHYMEETTTCDKVVIIDSGKIVASGTPHELKNEYAHDHIIWYTDKTVENDNIITKANLIFKYNKNAYVIKIDNSEMATKFIITNNDILKDYEVIKGNMDDVFLNVTGRKLGV